MRLLSAMLSRFVGCGRLEVISADGASHVFGDGQEPRATIRLKDPRLHRDLFFNPELKAGEAYMDGTLVFEHGTIRDLLMIFALNRGNLRGQPLQKSLRRALKRLRGLHQRNPVGRARAHVAHHYDLSNDFYRLFLDKDLNYSCAYFRGSEDTLETAQRHKQRHIAAKLALKPGQKVLDIGSGWGSMALYLAEHCDVEVLGVTLSEEQCALARTRAKQRGLDGQVRFELIDYRDVAETFDRVVSIGMFEHVGVAHYPEFFTKLDALLKPEGTALLHSIGRKGGPGTTGAWIRKYIFPGGYSPALSETLGAVEPTGLWVSDIEIWRLHYADTLVEWEKRFQKNRGTIAKMFDERFCRMWEFYLIISELSFRYGKHMVFQLQLTKSLDALPLARDYMAQAEIALTGRESDG
jgi:cyclopropane-fatty-acyl-phospholipid synthase